jgi:hypothetical protein
MCESERRKKEGKGKKNEGRERRKKKASHNKPDKLDLLIATEGGVGEDR